MAVRLKQLFEEGSSELRARLIGIYAVLAVLNVGGWAWAWVGFHDRPALLLVALAIYGLGLRHAVDADHIAAIDNVTRKLMQAGQRPVAIGFHFAMGHSTVVLVAAAAVAAAASALASFETLQRYGGIVGTLASIVFLFAIAAMNILVFISIYRSYRRVRGGKPYVEADIDMLVGTRGLLSRLFRPVFGLVTRSWHMYLVGFLFGLGFDTASEVAVFGVSAAQTAKGVPFVAIMVFPVLFAAGMALIDTTDGVLMLGAYEWAFVKPMRKLYYNMAITLVSVVVALVIGGLEGLGLLSDTLALKGRGWDVVGTLNGNFDMLGVVVLGVFLAVWALSYLVYRAKRLDDREAHAA